MKKVDIVFAILFFMLPSVSFAAALTSQQSSSLIAVVQSSPGTPASAFVSLITAFSNITVTQATSLITVVQASPGTSANAFVSLLTSFTVDTQTTQPATSAVTPQPTKTGYQVCSETFEHETWDGTYASNGKFNCVCQTGYVWNSGQASCQQESAVSGSLNAKISDLQSQLSTCYGVTTNTPVAEGNGLITYQAKTAQCQNITSELNVFLAEKGVIQQGGVMTQTCSNEIQDLEQKIYTLRQTALGAEAGALTTGTSVVAQGNAQRIAQAEAMQEAPLLQQVQQNLYYCQN